MGISCISCLNTIKLNEKGLTTERESNTETQKDVVLGLMTVPEVSHDDTKGQVLLSENDPEEFIFFSELIA